MRLPMSVVSTVLLAASAPPVGFAQSTRELAPTQIATAGRAALVALTALDHERTPMRQGSGFFVSSDGVVLTNYHVIEGAQYLRIRTATGAEYDNVFMISVDTDRDLAVLKIPIEGAPLLTLSPDPVQVGQRVYVVSNPLGLEGSFSDGVVSALRRIESVDLVQFTAPISQGSSGGALLNDRGQAVGIVTATFPTGQNLNLAIPNSYIRPLLTTGEQPRPFVAQGARAAPPSSTSGSPWRPVSAPEGTYDVRSLPDISGRTRTGDVVLYQDSHGHRLFGYWQYRPDSGGFRVIDDPITILPDGRVFAHIGGPLDGGFRNPNLFGVAPPANVSEIDIWLFERNTFDRETSEPTGFYPISGSRGIYRLTGQVVLVYTGYRGRGSNERLTLLRILAEDPGGLSMDFYTTAKLYDDGQIILEGTRVGDHDVTGHGYLRAGQLDLTVYRQITPNYYAEFTFGGRKTLR